MSYQPLGKTSAFDYRSTFSFSVNAKPAASETRYSAVNMDIIPGDQYMNPNRSTISWICSNFIKFSALLCFLLTLPFSAFFCLKMVRQYERLVVFRIGHLLPLKGPGVVLVLPCIDRWTKVDLRTKAFNIPPTRICTYDGGLILFGSIVHYRVQNPVLSKNSLQDMNHSVRVACQAAMTKILSKKRFADLSTNSSRYNHDIQVEINLAAVEWGLEIGRVELSQPTIEVVPPDTSKQGFFSKLKNGITNGGAGSIGQVMSMLPMGDNLQSQPMVQPLPIPPNSVSESVDTDAEKIMKVLRHLLNGELVKKINATYEIKLTDNDDYYYIDLKSNAGSCGKGRLPCGKPDATLILGFQTLKDLLSGGIGAFNAYTNGELDVEGDVKSVMRLEELSKALKTIVL